MRARSAPRNGFSGRVRYVPQQTQHLYLRKAGAGIPFAPRNTILPASAKCFCSSVRLSDLVWSGDDGFLHGAWRLPSFVEKLLSGNWDQGDQKILREPWWPNLGGQGVILLIECFNDME